MIRWCQHGRKKHTNTHVCTAILVRTHLDTMHPVFLAITSSTKLDLIQTLTLKPKSESSNSL